MGGEKENIRKAENLSFSLTKAQHVQCMIAEIEFLKKVSQFPLLFTAGPVLNNAIRRYETLFLPALAKAKPSEPLSHAPLDIEWIWHCHMLAPFYYENDCTKLIGIVPDHSVIDQHPNSYKSTFRSESHTVYVVSPAIHDIWSRHVQDGEPLEVDLSQETQFMGGPNYAPQSSYDLVSAVQRQSAFYYNVSLPHYRVDTFLTNAINRYKMMLQLKIFYPEAFLVPCYDMDLAWHTHQLHPHLYKKDTIKILGKMFNHDDNQTDRSAESHLTQSEQKTKQLWRDSYSMNMALSGAMYRGVSPTGKLSWISPQEEKDCADMLFPLEIHRLSVENLEAAKIKMVCYLGRLKIYEKKAKRNPEGYFNLATSKQLAEFSMYNDAKRLLTWSTSQTAEGCCVSAEKEGDVVTDLSLYLKRGVKIKQPLGMKSQLGKSLLTIEGEFKVPLVGGVTLKLQMGMFSNVVMPETVESMWGPVPLGRLPPGAVNHCTVANHTLEIVGGGSNAVFTARVIHSQPLLMSCVQIFYRDKMVAVSHLIGTDTVPEDTMAQLGAAAKDVIALRRSKGERGMLIKTAYGDRAFMFGHWANMKRGVPGTRYQRGQPGNPGNLRIRLSLPSADDKWINYPEQDVKGSTTSLPNIKIDLKKGLVELKSPQKIAENLALAFSVAVLNCLCQPPPPGMKPNADANKLGVVPPPPKYRPTASRGTKSVQYNDGADLAMVMAAGWLMASPSNYWIRTCYVPTYVPLMGGCGGACGGMAVCAACGGADGNGCACAGDGGAACGGDGGGCGG